MPDKKNEDNHSLGARRGSSRIERVRTKRYEIDHAIARVAIAGIAVVAWKFGAEELAFVIAAGAGYPVQST